VVPSVAVPMHISLKILLLPLLMVLEFVCYEMALKEVTISCAFIKPDKDIYI